MAKKVKTVLSDEDKATQTGHDPRNRLVYLIPGDKDKTFTVRKPYTGFEKKNISKAAAELEFNFQITCSHQ